MVPTHYRACPECGLNNAPANNQKCPNCGHDPDLDFTPEKAQASIDYALRTAGHDPGRALQALEARSSGREYTVQVVEASVLLEEIVPFTRDFQPLRCCGPAIWGRRA